MSDIKKVAIIGLGIGRSHITEGYLPHSDRYEVAVLCDLNEERLNAVGDEFGIEKRVKDFFEVLDMPDIDIIDICTPPGSHFELIMQALSAGKHVVCEKPLVGSLADVDAVIAADSKKIDYPKPDGKLSFREIFMAGCSLDRLYISVVGSG